MKKNKNKNKKMVRTSISIYKYQADWLDEKNINLSKLVRKLLDKEIMKYRES